MGYDENKPCPGTDREFDLRRRVVGDFSGGRGSQICIVLPVFNEAGILPEVMDGLFSYLGGACPDYLFELLFIDDASHDGSFEVIDEHRKMAPPNVRVSICRLSRNSGGHIAITAGLNLSCADFTVVMASDGQDPPEVVGQLIAGWKEGYNIVLAARQINLDQTPIERWVSQMAWRFMSWCTGVAVPQKGCDLLGMDRLALRAFNRMDERNTTFIFRIFSLGFRRKQVEYVKRARLGGRSKWNVWRKVHILLDAITGYSSRPLRVLSALGLVAFVVLAFRWIYMVSNIYIFRQPVTDLEVILNSIFTSLSVVILLLGIIGDYIWRILDEVRKRPVYEVAELGGERLAVPAAGEQKGLAKGGAGQNGISS